MTTYTVDLFTSLDGFGSGPAGYWGKDGPELLQQQARAFFAELVDSQLLDGRIDAQQQVYVPTVLDAPLGSGN